MTGGVEVLRIGGMSQFDPPELYRWLPDPAVLPSTTLVEGLLNHGVMA